ncbi:MAG: hypothetical protein HY761_01560 [Candidatus Omnitrophica bacterium]|nr:hypothetical protein [Candidatus Omnitrophota bacterium]
MSKTIHLLNFDDSVVSQQRLLSLYQPKIIDFKDLARRARLWMNHRTKNEIEARLGSLDRNCINLLGSGDFHHISSVLLNQFDEDFCVIVFDFHPDWDILPPRYGCGSWVTEALKNKRIQKCVLLGVSSNDISTWNIQTGNLSSLKNNRLEIYPYMHEPTTVFFRQVPENHSLTSKKGVMRTKILWQELRDKNIGEFILSILNSLPTKKIYISIDKDCLTQEFALTNWEQGLFSLDKLLLILRIINKNCEIIGVDITGEYSPAVVSGKLKAIISRLDHPKDVTAEDLSSLAVNDVNEETNLKILNSFIP